MFTGNKENRFLGKSGQNIQNSKMTEVAIILLGGLGTEKAEFINFNLYRDQNKAVPSIKQNILLTSVFSLIYPNKF